LQKEIDREPDREHRTQDERNEKQRSAQPSNSGSYGSSATTFRPGCQPATDDSKWDPKDEVDKEERGDLEGD
jgi:hypothetical protein